MPRIPRDVSGDDLIHKLKAYGYEATRQTSSHVRLTRTTEEGQFHVTVPRHRWLRVGTLNSVLSDVASHLGKGKSEVIRDLF